MSDQQVLRSSRHCQRAQSQGHHIDRMKERCMERGSARRSSLERRERAVVMQSDEHWNCFKGNLGETSGRRDGAHMSFFECVETIQNWTGLNRPAKWQQACPLHCHAAGMPTTRHPQGRFWTARTTCSTRQPLSREAEFPFEWSTWKEDAFDPRDSSVEWFVGLESTMPSDNVMEHLTLIVNCAVLANSKSRSTNASSLNVSNVPYKYSEGRRISSL